VTAGLLIVLASSLPDQLFAGEKMSFIENDQIRLGANLAIGGSITYLSTKTGPNMINSHDWGRQIQMSFYSGPKPFEPNGKKPNASWAQLGWNPIQSGDCYGNTSTLLEHRNDGKDSPAAIRLPCCGRLGAGGPDDQSALSLLRRSKSLLKLRVLEERPFIGDANALFRRCTAG